MNTAIQEGIRNGVPPFALCHLLARQRRLEQNGSWALRRLWGIAVRSADRTPAALKSSSVLPQRDPAALLQKALVLQRAMPRGAAYAAAGRFQHLSALASSGGEAFRSRHGNGTEKPVSGLTN